MFLSPPATTLGPLAPLTPDEDAALELLMEEAGCDTLEDMLERLLDKSDEEFYRTHRLPRPVRPA